MKLINKTMLAVATTLLGVVATPGNVMAADNVAVVSGIQGKVVLQRDGKQSLLSGGDQLLQGDDVITLNGSAIELTYDKTKCTKRYDASYRLRVSESAQCGGARLVQLGVKQVPVGSGGFPVKGTVTVSGGAAAGVAGAAGAGAAGAAGAAAAGAAGVAGLGMGVIGAGLLGVAAVAAVANNDDDDDDPVSES